MHDALTTLGALSAIELVRPDLTFIALKAYDRFGKIESAYREWIKQTIITDFQFMAITIYGSFLGVRTPSYGDQTHGSTLAGIAWTTHVAKTMCSFLDAEARIS
jgi:hypothetical protein